MAAPWSIVFYENILGAVLSDGVMGRTDDSVDGSLLGWNWLGFDMRGKFSGSERSK